MNATSTVVKYISAWMTLKSPKRDTMFAYVDTTSLHRGPEFYFLTANWKNKVFYGFQV